VKLKKIWPWSWLLRRDKNPPFLESLGEIFSKPRKDYQTANKPKNKNKNKNKLRSKNNRAEH